MVEGLSVLLMTLFIIFLVAVVLFTNTYEKTGHVRFIIRRVDKWSLLKEWLKFQPTYEGCFVYKKSYSTEIICIRFKTDRKNYLELVDDFLGAKKVKVSYTKYLLGRSKLHKKRL